MRQPISPTQWENMPLWKPIEVEGHDEMGFTV